MSRLGCFVFVYSVILLILFGVFCYLMSTVNPPAQIQDPGSRKYGTVSKSMYFDIELLQTVDSMDKWVHEILIFFYIIRTLYIIH